MKQTTESKNKDLVLEAFDTLFNKRNYAAAEKFWSPNYIQHSAHIPPGREGLFNLVKNAPPTLKYEHGTIVAEDDCVSVHGRFSGHGLGPLSWIAADYIVLWSSTGTCLRTKPPGHRPNVAFPCSAINSAREQCHRATRTYS
jgi:predicted SnoaL-like aldol condensation-catalyzing enzyme